MAIIKKGNKNIHISDENFKVHGKISVELKEQNRSNFFILKVLLFVSNPSYGKLLMLQDL